MRSGLQREVLHLYRTALRIVRTKPAHTRPKFLLLIRHTFRATSTSPTASASASTSTTTATGSSSGEGGGGSGSGSGTVSPRDFGTIEYLLRRRRKQLALWADPSVRDCWVSEEMRVWERRTGRGRRVGGQ